MKTIDFFNEAENTKVKQKFYAEVNTISGIRVKRFDTFEGMGFGTITILHKGEVTLYYDQNGLPWIRDIGEFDTGFLCPNNTMYPLVLTKNNSFWKLFPFQVVNLRQLVNHYDQIISILKTFPKSPNPNFTIDVPTGIFSHTSCNLYFNK